MAAGNTTNNEQPTTRRRRPWWPEVALVAFGLVIVFSGVMGLLTASNAAGRLTEWVSGTATPMDTATPSARVALPGDRFPDGVAFLEAGDEVHLLPYAGATPEPEPTVRARVVEVATGTRTAVLVETDPATADDWRVRVAAGSGLSLQYVVLTPTPTPDK